MKIKHLAPLLLLFIQCEDKIDVHYGDCKFAPANSKFQNYTIDFEDSYVRIQFMGQEYYFIHYKIEHYAGHYFIPEKNCINGVRNNFFYLEIISPNSAEILKGSVGLKTPFLKQDSIFIDKLNLLPPVSVSFAIKNLCGKLYEPLTGQDINQSSHTLTSVELLNSAHFVTNSGSYLRSDFHCTGELRANFIIDNKIQPMTGNYKMRISVYERE